MMEWGETSAVKVTLKKKKSANLQTQACSFLTLDAGMFRRGISHATRRVVFSGSPPFPARFLSDISLLQEQRNKIRLSRLLTEWTPQIKIRI